MAVIPLNIVLFNDFETLDAMGPAEVFGWTGEDADYRVGCFSLSGGLVTSKQGVRFDTRPLAEVDAAGVLLIPGGMGVRTLVDDAGFVARVAELAEQASFVLTVCTGSALLARTGLLDGREATTNKIAFDWVVSVRPAVQWVRRARWVADGKFYTSSGVTAGIDMALGFLADRTSLDFARARAARIEHIWSEDRENDPFARP